MKTTTAFKVKMIDAALAEGMKPEVAIGNERFKVAEIKNHSHSLTLTLDKNQGVLTVEPDAILYVWLPKLPKRLAI